MSDTLAVMGVVEQQLEAMKARAEKAEAALDQTPYDWRVMRNQAMKAEAERDAALAQVKELRGELDAVAKNFYTLEARVAELEEERGIAWQRFSVLEEKP